MQNHTLHILYEGSEAGSPFARKALRWLIEDYLQAGSFGEINIVDTRTFAENHAEIVKDGDYLIIVLDNDSPYRISAIGLVTKCAIPFFHSQDPGNQPVFIVEAAGVGGHDKVEWGKDAVLYRFTGSAESLAPALVRITPMTELASHAK